MNKPLVKQLLIGSNYWVLNKTVVETFGLETAFILSNLAEAESMMADEDGWFYQTSETLEKITGLSKYKQDKSIKQLEDAGILIKDVRGMPAKKYFKLDFEKLHNQLLKNLTTSRQNSSQQVVKNFNTNKELNNKENDSKESTINTLSSSDEHDRIPYQSIVSYLNQKTGKSYRSSTKKTKALIKARFNEGFTEDDFKKVVDVKTNDWSSDKAMSKYLRPETLFGTKFEGYLNEEEAESYGGIDF